MKSFLQSTRYVREEKVQEIPDESFSPLDHRGEPTEPVDKKAARRSLTREHSNNVSTKKELRSPCLSGVIYPLISEVCLKIFLS